MDGIQLQRWQRTVMVTMPGEISAAEGCARAEHFIPLVGVDNVIVVLDLSGLTKLHREARLAWRQALWVLRKQIEQLYVFAPRLGMRLGVSASLILGGIPFRFIDDLRDVPGMWSLTG